MDLYAYNQKAWTKEVEEQNRYTIPLSEEEMNKARNGHIHMPLTPVKPVPMDWIGDVSGKNVLCLAASGGQQAPLFALMGAKVTVLDICSEQLQKDIAVATREGLMLRTVQGSMTDLHCFADESFDMIFHALSNCFIEDVQPLWQECYRVLKPHGTLIAGFFNPVNYLFDMDEMAKGRYVVKYRLPYSDLHSLDKERLDKYIADGEPLEFGHTLESQIGGQLKAGFVLRGLYEDNGGSADGIDRYMDVYMATLATKEKTS